MRYAYRHQNSYGGSIPPQSGTLLYAPTKSLGHEVCRVFTEHHDIHVLNFLFYNFRDLRRAAPGSSNQLKPGSNPPVYRVVVGRDTASGANERLRLIRAEYGDAFVVRTE